MKNEKVENLEANFHDKTEYVIHIINLKEALNHRLDLKKILRVIKFNQNAWLKPRVDINTDLRYKTSHNRKKNKLFVRTKFHTTKIFTENL